MPDTRVVRCWWGLRAPPATSEPCSNTHRSTTARRTHRRPRPRRHRHLTPRYQANRRTSLSKSPCGICRSATRPPSWRDTRHAGAVTVPTTAPGRPGAGHRVAGARLDRPQVRAHLSPARRNWSVMTMRAASSSPSWVATPGSTGCSLPPLRSTARTRSSAKDECEHGAGGEHRGEHRQAVPGGAVAG